MGSEPPTPNGVASPSQPKVVAEPLYAHFDATDIPCSPHQSAYTPASLQANASAQLVNKCNVASEFKVLVLFSGPQATANGIDVKLQEMGCNHVYMVDVVNEASRPSTLTLITLGSIG